MLLMEKVIYADGSKPAESNIMIYFFITLFAAGAAAFFLRVFLEKKSSITFTGNGKMDYRFRIAPVFCGLSFAALFLIIRGIVILSTKNGNYLTGTDIWSQAALLFLSFLVVSIAGNLLGKK